MAYVQYADDATTGTAAASVTLTVTNGNYLVAWAGGESDTTAPTISTTSGSTSAWTNAQTVVDATNFFSGTIATATATATGSVTIGTGDVGNWNSLMVMEFSNIDSVSTSAITAAGGDTSDPRTTTATTPSGYDAMLVGAIVDWSGSTPTNNSGWTDVGTGMDYSGTDIGRAQYRLYTSGTGQASFNGTDANPCFVAHVFLIESSGALTASGTPTLTGATAAGTAGFASSVTITDVDGDETWTDGDTGLIITGSGFV